MERVEYGTDGNPYKLFVSTGIENKEQFSTVIPKAYAQKAIEEALKYTSENVLAIVREEYISKADYENRLKADMVAVLDKIRAEIEELFSYVEFDEDTKTSYNMVRLEEVQRVIDKYRGESEDV